MKKRFLFLVGFAILMLNYQYGHSQVYKDPKQDIEKRIHDLLDRMTLEEKIDQLSGVGDLGFDTRENKRSGIPAFKMTDGPLGVRWGKATSFPSGVSVAATWDTNLVYRFAVALAEETHAKGRNYLLGPCVNIHRLPNGGRNFESYGEDPYLTSRLAVNYIKALQSQQVIASIKHFALNNQEWQRTEVNVRVDERAMREIYLPSFEAAVKEAGVYTVMSAYNKVNGWWCSENTVLLTDILKNEWGFTGLVVSDWGSTHSTGNAAQNGLDLEMPSGVVFSMAELKKGIDEGNISENIINDKVSHILWVKFKAGLFDQSFIPDTTVLTGDAHKKLALELAEESIVLLKNKNNLLPLNLNNLKKIAVIGPNAAIARVGGGGSSHVTPYYSVSPLEGIKKLVGSGIEVVFAQGDKLQSLPFLPVGKQFFQTWDKHDHGLNAEYFKNPRLEGEPGLSRVDTTVYFDWEDSPPAQEIEKDKYSVRWSGFILPPVSRTYTFYTASDDGVRLFINGKNLIGNWKDHGTTVDSGKIELVAGKPYDIKLEYYENGGSAVIMLGWDLPGKNDLNTMIDDAVKIARGADVAIVFAGTSADFESEGFDRIGGLKLPGKQDELIKSIAEANPNTIVVLNTGTPVITENWLNKIPVLIEAFFPGQEGGNAIAEILFGRHNPLGKLPFSFIGGYDQSPAYKNYKDKSLSAPYDEGIFVGYRYLEKNNLVPTFPFGHGLSYTTFDYSGLTVEKRADSAYEVTLNVKNSGKMTGSETVQLYISDDHSPVPRPVKELKGFVKILLEPGEIKKVTMHLNSRSFAYYDLKINQWKVTPGYFDLMAGSSSSDIKVRTKLLIN